MDTKTYFDKIEVLLDHQITQLKKIAFIPDRDRIVKEMSNMLVKTRELRKALGNDTGN